MAANDVVVICYDPAADTNLARAVVYTRAMRSNMRFSHGVPGGNLTASWTVSCDHIADVGFPKPRARVLIMDLERGTFLWRGVLQKPIPTWERGKLTEVEFNAVGCAEGSLRQFADPTVFGVAGVTSTVTGRHIVVDFADIMQYGLTICPLIDGTQANIASGGVLTEDTRDYKGQSASQLWEDICNLTRGYATPFIWLVQPDDTGHAALEFYAEAPNPRYFEHGNAKTNKLEVDWAEIANLVYVAFQAEIFQFPAIGDPLDETNTPDIQTHFVDVSTDVQERNTAQGFVESLYTKFNQRTVTGGSITLDRDIRTNINGTPEIIPVYEIRAGVAIEVEVTKIPYLGNVVLDLPISAAEYNEDACEMTLSTTPLTQAGKNARMLALRAEHSKMSWAWASKQLTSPAPDLQKVPMPGFVGVHNPGFYINGWGDAASSPSVAFLNGGGTLDPSENPNPIPTPVTQDPPANAEPPLVKPIFPLAAQTRAYGMGMGFGPFGMMLHPQGLPPERVNIPAQFSTVDPITGDLTDGERMHTDVQEAYIDTFDVSTLNASLVAVTVKVDIWNWDLNAIRVSDAFELELDGSGAAVRFQFDNSDPEHKPILLFHGDQLRWKVEGADEEAILNCALSGWKNWSQFPVLIGPDSVPGNA